MARTPNYQFDRMQRDKAKAQKKAEKAAAKAKQAEEAAAADKPAESAGNAPANPSSDE